jgi:hypothetical protein
LVVGFERHAEFPVVDSQVAVAAAHDRIGPDRLHFLRHNTNIGLVAAVVREAVEAETVVETAKQNDVVLEPDVGAPSTAAATAATTAASAAATTAAAGTGAAAATTAAAKARTSARGLRPGSAA